MVLDVVHAVLGVLALALQQLEALLVVVGGHAVHGLVRAVLHEGWAHALEEVHSLVAKLGDEVFEALDSAVLFLGNNSHDGDGQEDGEGGEDDGCEQMDEYQFASNSNMVGQLTLHFGLGCLGCCEMV